MKNRTKEAEILKILDELDELRRASDVYSDFDFRCIEADIAKLIGIKNRNDWTGLLMEDQASKYYHYYNSGVLTFR